MPSALQDINFDDLDWDNLTRDQLVDIAENDDRVTARSKAAGVIAERDTPPRLDTEEYNPRTDLGPERYEDRIAREQAEGEESAPLSAEEVPPEASIRDETTVLASDVFTVDDENNIIKI